MVSRLTWQKGIDLLAEASDELVGLGAKLAVLGAGEAWLERAFQDCAARHPGRIGVTIGYNEPLAHLMQGGGDAIVIRRASSPVASPSSTACATAACRWWRAPAGWPIP